MERYNDEELLYLIRCGNEDAKNTLLTKYYHCISSWIKSMKYYYVETDLDDYKQIGIISLWNALDTYRNDLNASLYTYIKMVVTNRIMGAMKNNISKSYSKENYVISLDEYVDEDKGLVYEEVIEDSKVDYQPSKIFMIKETTAQYLTQFEMQATFIEKEVILHKYAGYDEKEISEILNIPIKSVYNAVYRSHKKSALTMKNKYDKL